MALDISSSRIQGYPSVAGRLYKGFGNTTRWSDMNSPIRKLSVWQQVITQGTFETTLKKEHGIKEIYADLEAAKAVSNDSFLKKFLPGLDLLDNFHATYGIAHDLMAILDTETMELCIVKRRTNFAEFGILPRKPESNFMRIFPAIGTPPKYGKVISYSETFEAAQEGLELHPTLVEHGLPLDEIKDKATLENVGGYFLVELTPKDIETMRNDFVDENARRWLFGAY